VAAAAGTVAALTLAFSPLLAASGSVWTVASGQNNPRGIDVGASGHVFVAEAGAGRIDVIRGGRLSTWLGGLPTATSPEGETTGPTNVAVHGDGNVVAVVGGGPQQVDARFNSVISARPARVIADIQAYVNAHPDTTDLDQPPNPTDSNPYGAAWLNNRQTLVTDAANNTLLLVNRNGSVQTVAKFPNELISTAGAPIPNLPPMLPAEAVPTTVTIGPDGYWYVGELKGFPFTPGTSRIWRVAPWARDVTCSPAATSGACTLYRDGFTAVTGIDFGPDGSLYVVEIARNGLLAFFGGFDDSGALLRIAKNGQVTELAAGMLHAPDDVAVAGNGTVYVTNMSVSPDSGEVLAVRP
jgi:sugar lactone lactonase YvrE